MISDRQIALLIGPLAVVARRHWRAGHRAAAWFAAASTAAAWLIVPILLWTVRVAWATGGPIRIALVAAAVAAAVAAVASVVLAAVHDRIDPGQPGEEVTPVDDVDWT